MIARSSSSTVGGAATNIDTSTSPSPASRARTCLAGRRASSAVRGDLQLAVPLGDLGTEDGVGCGQGLRERASVRVDDVGQRLEHPSQLVQPGRHGDLGVYPRVGDEPVPQERGSVRVMGPGAEIQGELGDELDDVVGGDLREVVEQGVVAAEGGRRLELIDGGSDI